ncbi:MAG: MotA/TolQ/ExbB proton channel family protein [Rhizobiales bacterium]|nr:MotA/TolQ/ExbB proton channel family protein [Hyphomicrobiales bacterium]
MASQDPSTAPPTELLQEPASTASAATLPTTSEIPIEVTDAATPFSLFGLDLSPALSLIDKGGFVVVVLLVMSVVATTVILVKIVRFLCLGLGSRRKVERALRLWFDGRREEARRVLTPVHQPAARVLAGCMCGLMSGCEERHVREDVERLAMESIADLRRHLRLLDVTVQAAPLLGLFGTVLGMIGAFQALQSAGADADPTVLAGGIWVALMTTAVGLAVAIPIAFVSAWLEGRIEAERGVMESAVTSLLTGRASEGDPTRLAGNFGQSAERMHYAVE